MYINDYIKKITIQKELKNVKEQLKAVQDENVKLKQKNDSLKAECKLLLNKVYGTESLKEDVGFDNDQINISDEDFLKYRLSNKEGKIKELEAKIEMLENDRKEGLLTCCNCSHGQQYRIKQLKDELSKSNTEKHELEAKIEMLSRDADKILKEKRQEVDNLRDRNKDLEAEIDQLKSNPSTVSDSESLTIPTEDDETFFKLLIFLSCLRYPLQ